LFEIYALPLTTLHDPGVMISVELQRSTGRKSVHCLSKRNPGKGRKNSVKVGSKRRPPLDAMDIRLSRFEWQFDSPYLH